MEALKEFIVVTLWYNKFNELPYFELQQAVDTFKVANGFYALNLYTVLVLMERNGEILWYMKETEKEIMSMVMLL